MRLFGQFLSLLGLTVGVLLGIAMLFPVHLVGVAWIIGVGLAKLTFAASLGLIGSGAVIQRLANRDEKPNRLSEPRAP